MTTSLTALTHARVLTPEGFREGVAVLLRGTHIEAVVGMHDQRLVNAKRHDLDGHWLLPGFIDVQVNGGHDHLFNDDPSIETIAAIAAAHRHHGTTGLLPTLITDTAEKMHAALSAVDDAVAAGIPGVLGLHLEGPFLSMARKGVHDARLFRLPDAADLAMLTRPRRGVLMLTLAPEQVHPAVIRTLRDAGVIVCAGHSAADYDTTQTALAAGLSGFTHLYNAMSPLTSREPGMVGAALENAASWCGLINDGHHVHAAALRIALAAKPRGKCVLVTDAMPPVGGTKGSFLLQGEHIKVHDGVCCNASGVLAGSVLDMASAVRNTVRVLGASLEEAARMASTYPAAWLGLERTHGCIASGYRADLVMMDESLQVQRCWIGGITSSSG